MPGADIFDFLYPPHIQKRIRTAFFVAFGTLVGFKAHVFIKSYRLRILLIDGKLLNVKGLHAALQQKTAEPFPSSRRGEAKQFQPVNYNAQ